MIAKLPAIVVPFIKVSSYLVTISALNGTITWLALTLMGVQAVIIEVGSFLAVIMPIMVGLVKLGIDAFYDAKEALHTARAAKSQSDLNTLVQGQLVEVIKALHPDVNPGIVTPIGEESGTTTVGDNRDH